MDTYTVSALAFVFSEYAHLLGMQAENMQRQHLGQAMAYMEYDFAVIAGHLQSIAIEIRNAK